VLAEWRMEDLSDAVTHVVSELIANSVSATGKVHWEAGLPPVRLWLPGGAGPRSFRAIGRIAPLYSG
jgi:hypothetical protein